MRGSRGPLPGWPLLYPQRSELAWFLPTPLYGQVPHPRPQDKTVTQPSLPPKVEGVCLGAALPLGSLFTFRSQRAIPLQEWPCANCHLLYPRAWCLRRGLGGCGTPGCWVRVVWSGTATGMSVRVSHPLVKEGQLTWIRGPSSQFHRYWPSAGLTFIQTGSEKRRQADSYASQWWP